MMATALLLIIVVLIMGYGNPKYLKENDWALTLMAVFILMAFILAVASLVVFAARVMP